MTTLLTQEQTNQYLTSQSGVANPLSPMEWLAKQGVTQTNPPANTPNNTPVKINPAPVDSMINGVSRVDINTPTVTPAPIVTNTAQSIIDQTKVEDTLAQKQAKQLSQNIIDLLPNLQGEASTLAAEKNKAGIIDLNKQLTDINNQANTLTSEINQGDTLLASQIATIEDKPVAMEFITGEQAGQQRQAQIVKALKSAQLQALNARALALQGNIALAEQTAKNAVDIKYAPYKEAINIYQEQLKALEPILTSDEKEQARQQSIKSQLALSDLETKKADEKAKSDLIIKAAAYAPKDLLDRASQATSSLQAAQILGQYAGDYLQNMKLRAEIAKLNAETGKIRNEISTSDKYVVNNKQYTKEQYSAGEQAGNIKTILSGIKTMITNNQGFQGAVGAGVQKFPVISWFVGDDTSKFASGSDARTFDLKVQQLKNALALPNLSYLKGATSDKDIMFLKNIATSLDTGMTEEEFKKELTNIEESIGNVEKKYNISVSDFVSPEITLQDTIDSADKAIKNSITNSTTELYKSGYTFNN